MAIDIKLIPKQKTAKVELPQKNIFDFLNKDIKLFGNGLSDKTKEAFFHELSILLIAGIDIKTALELIAQEQAKPSDAVVFEKIKNDIIKGSTLSGALRDTNQFSNYEFYSIQIGEESGKLTRVLSELALFYQKKIKQRRQMVGALTYPAIVLCTSFGAIFFMMNFVVPMFADVFKRFGGDLPVLTQTILNASHFFSSYFWLFILFIISIIVFVFTQRNELWYRKNSTALLLKIPIVGEMMRKIYLARFCNSMTLLIGSKIPILRAIGLIKQMIGFYPIEISLEQVEKDILLGKSLHESLAAFTIYHKRMISLLKVGEEVNKLESFFDKIAQQYNDDVEHQTTLISGMIEPFMIIFLGVIVGVILIAMYLPLFQLSSTF